MKKDFPYQIQHVNIHCLLQNGYPLPQRGNEYRVYWWDNIPLAHLWIGSGSRNNASACIKHQLVWKSISGTLQSYCNKQKSISLEQLSSYWEKENHECCLAILEKLFCDHQPQIQHFSSDVSLIICTHNRPAQLKNCLNSLSQLSIKPKEIIVVDNAPDNEETKQLVKQFPFIRYVLDPEKGLDHARNTGWQNASSSIVAYIDDDVRLHKDWIWETERAFDHPRVMAITGLVFAAELNTEAQVIFEKYWSFNRGYKDIYYDSDYFKAHFRKGVPAWNIGAGANMAFRRHAFQTSGGFDTRLDAGASGCSGDSELWYRLMAAGWTIHYTPRVIAYHTHRKGKKELKKQIYFYLRGAATSLLAQHQRHRHLGNLYHLYKTLPIYYFSSAFLKFRYPFTKRYSTLLQEVKGYLSGIQYFYTHKQHDQPVYHNAFPVNIKRDPLVSTIITTYNHGQYLKEAIESVLKQTYSNLEIIVIDDGSTDNTGEIVSQYPQVKYIKQKNKGLSAARNAGIFNSKGEYLVFLDADDLLYPCAVAKNLDYFHCHAECAFVSGWHDRIDENKRLMSAYENTTPQKDHYQALLCGNYIGMHAAVMYRREVFDLYLFNETLPACEDYDLYLRITKRYPVFSHNEKLAAYRIHNNNMSNNISLMFKNVKRVLRQNYIPIKDQGKHSGYSQGKNNWKKFYAGQVYDRLAFSPWYPYYHLNLRDAGLVISALPRQLIKLYFYKTVRKGYHLFRRIWQAISSIKRIFGGGSKTIIPKPGNIRMGDLRRTRPFSINFGYDRGGPVDRYYIENFLKENADDIKGRVLEIGDNVYTRTFGGERVKKSDILHVDQTNPQATITGDLSHADHIPAEQFDCIVLTQTLHLIFDFKSALKQCYRILKHGGTLLLTVPGITPIDHGQWKDTWYWSFTGKSIQKLLSEHFDPLNIQVQTHGNVLAATAFLYGMGHKEISAKEIVQNDSHYQVIIAAKATKN